MDLDNPIELVPVSQWVYDLYMVDYWTCENGRIIKTVHIASSSENHLESEANRNCPPTCEWMSWKVVKENVGHPRVIGQMYGQKVHEDGFTHGQRLVKG